LRFSATILIARSFFSAMMKLSQGNVGDSTPAAPMHVKTS
jgi:hypothetical protein